MSADVLLTRSDERDFLTHVESGRVFELNATARSAFELLRDVGVEEAARRMAERYPEVDPAEVARDVRAFADELAASGLLSRA